MFVLPSLSWRSTLASGGPASPRNLEERVRQRDAGHVPGQLGVDHESHRQSPGLARGERLLREAEAFDLLEVLAGELRTVARHGLRGHRHAALVDHFILDRRELARMHVEVMDERPEA